MGALLSGSSGRKGVCGHVMCALSQQEVAPGHPETNQVYYKRITGQGLRVFRGLADVWERPEGIRVGGKSRSNCPPRDDGGFDWTSGVDGEK